MKLNQHEECKSSSSSEEAEMGGHGRSYECVFCKRGFTTAQALGGHMNIHRRDRAKPKPKPSRSSSSAFSSRLDEVHTSFRGYPLTPTYEECKSSSSSEETEMGGHGRSYECVFCKRGFTTAQALGGHMNIHRKDRAKPKPKPSRSSSSAFSSRLDEVHTSFRGYPLTPTYEECKSSSSSEETEMGGHGRSYECVFCKRGFTTAQALGGHMNIHRKDRAKPKPKPSRSSSSAFSSRLDEVHTSFRGYLLTQTYPSYYPTMHHEEHANNYQNFYRASSTWGYTPSSHEQSYEDDGYGRNSYNYSTQYGEDWRSTGLSLQIGIGSGIDDEDETRSLRRGMDEDELDLELRLGHHHRYN